MIPVYEPYKLSAKSIYAPVCFELEFIVEGTRYLYTVHFTKYEVIYEQLRYYSVGEKRTTLTLLFERNKDDDWDSMSFGGHFKGGARKIPFFKNQAYLSKAGNSPDTPEFIRKIYQFFSKNAYFIKQGKISLKPSWKLNKELVKGVTCFLNSLDDGINNMKVVERDVDKIVSSLPKNIPEEIKADILDDLGYEIFLERQTKNGFKALLSLEEESDGIRSMMNSLPLLMQVIYSGSVLVWDELETSLHPHIAELVVSLFNDPAINKNNAQLLFTTHNLALMNSKKMRKDQLWLIEKIDGVSELISLDEFASSQLKNDSPFAKWYYDGRLGGLPSIDYAAIKRLFTGSESEG